MQIIPTRVHGILDYVVSIILIGLPYLFDVWQDGGMAVGVPVVLGIGTIVYSLLTDYELSIVRLIPMRMHLLLDILAGAVLAVSPWVFGFADKAWAPYLVLGLLEIGLSLLTNPQPRPMLRRAS